jgi:ATP-dependent Lhr-like helicase
VRERDLALELPRSPLTSVMADEVWGEVYDRLAELVERHRTTLIFVNQRRVAERAARHLAERIGEQHVTAHHGSLAREHRLDAEQRLKAGELKALVATSSLELGIDIGDIDLVCQLGSPRSVNAFLQRVGRAGHAIGAIPKGGCFRSRSTTCSNAARCSTRCSAASSTASTCRTSRSTRSRSRSSPRSRAASGSSTRCTGACVSPTRTAR